MVLECEDNLLNMYRKWGCERIPVNYNLIADHPLNIMIKSEGELGIVKYQKIKSLIQDFNQIYFLKKELRILLTLFEQHKFNLAFTKYIKKLFVIIYSILRSIFGNSRIYYNFPEGKP